MFNALLVEATLKVLELNRQPDWSKQLLQRAPPVLWFGDALRQKANILTLGANPSRYEFLEPNQGNSIEEAVRTGDQSRLRYLQEPRFRVLQSDEKREDILTNERLQNEILTSFSKYFCTNPYEWFGHNRDSSYKVEGFLRGFGASYFDVTHQSRSAVHIDLFPFVTLEDFSKLSDMVERDLFRNGWAEQFLQRLITYLSPEVLVVFGRNNLQHCCKYLEGKGIETLRWKKFAGKSASYAIFRSSPLGLPVLGLSTNLGNPRGFTALELNDYGRCLRMELSQCS